MSAFYDGLMTLSAPFCFGALLGLIHFMGLLATVSRLPEIKHPYLILILSFVIRMAIVIGGLYWIGMGQWQRLLAALAGLILARVILLRHSGQPEKQPNPSYDSGDH